MTSEQLESSHYLIEIGSALDARWAVWFDGLTLARGPNGTTLLFGQMDQATLYGTFAKLRNLGLTLISVARVQDKTTY